MTNSKNNKTLTTTGEIRNALAECLVRMQKGTLPPTEAKAIVGLANQITNSLAVELKYRTQEGQLGHAVSELGALNISAASK